MKRILLILLAAACLYAPISSSAQTKIDLSKQKGVVPIQNGGTGNSGLMSITQSPTVMNFNQVQTTTTSPAKLLSITIGNVPVTISSVVFTGSAGFTSSGSSTPTGCNGPQVAGTTCVLPVTYAPTGAIAETGLITINSNATPDSQGPDTVFLTGTGIGTTTYPVTINGAGLGAGEFSSGEIVPLIDGLFVAGAQTGGTYSNNYATGSVITMTAASSDGGTSSISGSGCTSNPCGLTVSGPITLTATFNPPVPSENLNLTALGTGGGLLTSDVGDANGILDCLSTAGVISSAGNTGCSGSFPQGTPITVKEVADASSVFIGWSGPCTGTASTCVVTLNSAQTLTANFAPTAVSTNFSLPQTRANCSVTGANIACNWLSAQTAGNTNVCAVSWGDNTTTVSSVSDTGGNTYNKVAGASSTTTGLSQSIYYAQNISAAGAGVRTTTFALSTSGASSVAGTALYSNHAGGASTSYASSSVTMASNNLILATTYAALSTGPGSVSSVTGGGLTWVKVAALTFDGGTIAIEVWRAMGSGSSGAVTATWSASPVTRGMSISEFSGADLTGTNGSGAIGITASNSAGSATSSVTMGTFGSASNATFQVTGTGAGVARTAGTGMTLLGSDGEITDEWAAGNVTTPQQTFTSQQWGAIGIEIKAAGGSAARRDARCGEYAGILASGSPVDVSAVGTGSSTSPASGSLTTTVANDLLTGFPASVSSSVSAVSPNFTQQIKNSYGDDFEDREGVGIGAYNFQPTLAGSSGWISSLVAWKPAGTGGGPPPNVVVTAQGNGSGNGSIVGSSGSPSMNCASVAGVTAGACASSLASGSSDTFTAFTSAGSVFGGWLGEGCGTVTPCTATNITSSGTIRATFNLTGQQAYYVSPSGNDSNSGTQSSPWLNISHAIAAFTLGPNGTVIHVAAGTYGEALSCAGNTPVICVNRGGTSTTQALILQCDTQWSVPSGSGCLLRNNGGTNGAVVVTANFVTVNGFDYSNAGGGFGITAKSVDHLTIQNNYLHDIAQTPNDGAGAGCPHSGGVLTYFDTSLKIIGNRISNFGLQSGAIRNGGTCNVAHGIYDGSTGSVVEDNVIIQPAAYGIQIYNNPCNVVVSNNTIDQAGEANIVIAGGSCSPVGLITINNNILESAPAGAVQLGANGSAGTSPCTATTRVKISNNLLAVGEAITTAGSLNGCTDVSGTIFEAPTTTFTGYSGSSTNNSYVLKGGSAALGGGTGSCVAGGITPCVPSFTFTGAAEPTPINIGAYKMPAFDAIAFDVGFDVALGSQFGFGFPTADPFDFYLNKVCSVLTSQGSLVDAYGQLQERAEDFTPLAVNLPCRVSDKALGRPHELSAGEKYSTNFKTVFMRPPDLSDGSLLNPHHWLCLTGDYDPTTGIITPLPEGQEIFFNIFEVQNPSRLNHHLEIICEQVIP